MPLKYVKKARDLTTQHASQRADGVGVVYVENRRSKKVYMLLTGQLMQGLLQILLTESIFTPQTFDKD